MNSSEVDLIREFITRKDIMKNRLHLLTKYFVSHRHRKNILVPCTAVLLKNE